MGVSDVHDEIYLELSTGRPRIFSLCLTLMFNFLFVVLLAKSCSVLKQDVKQFKLKLTNKETPCLTLEMEVVSYIIMWFTLQLKTWSMGINTGLKCHQRYPQYSRFGIVHFE